MNGKVSKLDAGGREGEGGGDDQPGLCQFMLAASNCCLSSFEFIELKMFEGAAL